MLLFCIARTLTAFTQASSSITPAFLYLKREKLKSTVPARFDKYFSAHRSAVTSHKSQPFPNASDYTIKLSTYDQVKIKASSKNVTVQNNCFQHLHSHLLF